MPAVYFEELKLGQRLSCQPIRITRQQIISFARQYDPHFFHIDEEAAAQSIFKGLVASSLHTISACTKVVVEALGETVILTGLGIEEVRLPNPVRPGDTLHVEAWWDDLRRLRSKPDRGAAILTCTVTNQRAEPVVHYGYRYLVACRREG